MLRVACRLHRKRVGARRLHRARPPPDAHRKKDAADAGQAAAAWPVVGRRARAVGPLVRTDESSLAQAPPAEPAQALLVLAALPWRRSEERRELPPEQESAQAPAQRREPGVPALEAQRALRPPEQARALQAVSPRREPEPRPPEQEAQAGLPAACVHLLERRLWRPCRPWLEIPRRLPPELVPECFCELFPRRLRGWNWSASSFH